MCFVFKTAFHHLVKQYIVLIKKENLTDKSKVPLDYSLDRLSGATQCPSGLPPRGRTGVRTLAWASVGAPPTPLPFTVSEHSCWQHLYLFLCLRDFSVAIGTGSARELGKFKC